MDRQAGNSREPCKVQRDWLWAHHPGLTAEQIASLNNDAAELRRLFQDEFGLEATHIVPPPTSGKWVLGVPCPRVTACWDLVREATEAGRLGLSAKVAPEDQAREWHRTPDSLEHVLCVYTPDWRDLEDVLRVGRELFTLGATALSAKSLTYKPNAFNYLRHPGEAARRLSPWIYRLDGPTAMLSPQPGLSQWAERRLAHPLCGWEETAEDAAAIRDRLSRQLHAERKRQSAEAQAERQRQSAEAHAEEFLARFGTASDPKTPDRLSSFRAESR